MLPIETVENVGGIRTRGFSTVVRCLWVQVGLWSLPVIVIAWIVLFLVLLAPALVLNETLVIQSPALRASTFSRWAVRLIFIITIFDVTGLSALVRLMCCLRRVCWYPEIILRDA